MDEGMTIVGLGESLWDLLPSGKQLGGTPLNVAVHAQQLLGERGGRGIAATSVGVDRLGDEMIAELAARGMSIEHVQRDLTHPTGTVQVELRDGQLDYQFVSDVAWDHLEFTSSLANLASSCSAVCFGTLAQRAVESRETIWRFLDAAKHATRLLDVNLRPPFYTQRVLEESCRRASIVKLSEQELPTVVEALVLPVGAPVFQLAQLRARYELDAVVYTRGQRGTMVVLQDKVISPPAVSYPFAADADTVGAGDACAAAILAGWALGLPPAKIAEVANHMGAFVASSSGATPTLPPNITQLLNS